MRLLKESYNSDSDFIKIIKRFLLDPIHSHKRASGMTIIHSAIKSYFETNDCPLVFKFNPKTNYKTTDDEDEKPSLIHLVVTGSLFLFKNNGSPSCMSDPVFLYLYSK